MGPPLGPNQPKHGVESLQSFTTRILQGLAADEADECRAALSRGIADGTMLWAEPYHRASEPKVEPGSRHRLPGVSAEHAQGLWVDVLLAGQ